MTVQVGNDELLHAFEHFAIFVNDLRDANREGAGHTISQQHAHEGTDQR